jgi:hypothetical protein
MTVSERAESRPESLSGQVFDLQVVRRIGQERGDPGQVAAIGSRRVGGVLPRSTSGEERLLSSKNFHGPPSTGPHGQSASSTITDCLRSAIIG